MKLIIAAFLFIFSPLCAANSFDEFLNGTTWCFDDTAGAWDHGRMHFVYEPWGFNSGFYDVTDAPGNGGIQFGWQTHYSIWGWRMVIVTGQGPNHREQWALVDFPDGEHMSWSWDDVVAPSILRRCQ